MTRQVQVVEGGLEQVKDLTPPRPTATHPELSHRVIADIPYIPTPQQVLNTILRTKGWPYKTDDKQILQRLQTRDRALPSILYVGELRIGEAIQIRKSQFHFNEALDAWEIRGVKLVKEKITRNGIPIPRKHTYREKIFLPKEAERKPFTDLILEWVDMLEKPEDRLFPWSLRGKHHNNGRVRAWQIINAMTGLWNHYFRMIGENYRFQSWDQDLMATANYLQVDPRTLIHYLKGDFERKPRV